MSFSFWTICFSLLMVLFLSFKLHAYHFQRYSPLGRRPRSTSSFLLQMRLEVDKLNGKIATQLQNGQMIIEALRGRKLNDNDQQIQGIDMKVVEIQDSKTDKKDRLPTSYDPVQLEKYFAKRPFASAQRLWQVVSVSSSYLFGLAFDVLTGNTEDLEVRRAAELRNTIVSLGPFFIKLGQALSIRPDILSPKAMVELQQLCDKVPSFDNALAMKTIEEEFQKPVSEIFSEISSKPVAAASLGQVYQARLKENNSLVAVKVQRPFVLETVSLDLHLMRQVGLFLRKFPAITARLDIVSLLDQFANNFYQELDYQLECENGLRIKKDMEKIPKVVIPMPFQEYCTRRVHVAEWISGEKLSQSKAADVNSLINLGVITYLTQLLETGLLHSDPHPGNLLRTEDGRLVLLDFGLMTKITDDQKYGMIEAIAHLIHRDYDQIGDDFKNLDFIPKEVDVAPLIPVLTRVFEAALAGGGAKSINFQELAADLAEITFKFPFRIPPYFALIIRAISVLEGIALVGNPEFAIVDEAYPFIAKKLLTDRSERARSALRYMIYGKSDSLDVERMIDILVALEKFIKVKDYGDGASFKVDGLRGGQYVGKAGESVGTRSILRSSTFLSKIELPETPPSSLFYDEKDLQTSSLQGLSSSSPATTSRSVSSASASAIAAPRSSAMREALKFFFSDEGQQLREFVLDEMTNGIDALSRDAFRALLGRLSLLPSPASLGLFALSNSFPFGRSSSLPRQFLETLAPDLSEKDEKTVDNLAKLVSFLLGSGTTSTPGGLSKLFPFLSLSRVSTEAKTSSLALNTRQSDTQELFDSLTRSLQSEEKRREILAVLPAIHEYMPNIQDFLFQMNRKLIEKISARALDASLDVVFGLRS